jgi:hypothetical protein
MSVKTPFMRKIARVRRDVRGRRHLLHGRGQVHSGDLHGRRKPQSVADGTHAHAHQTTCVTRLSRNESTRSISS